MPSFSGLEKTEGRISISMNSDCVVTIMIEDKTSGKMITYLEMTSDEFGKAVCGLSSSKCSYTTFQ